MTQPDLAVAASLLPRFDASPTPYHAVETVIAQLETAGFIDVSKASALVPGRQFWHDGGALIAWATSPDHHAASGYRIVGAHTDSPNLRIKPSPDNQTAGWKQLGVEVYGGALLNSWLDRDLGLAGRVVVRTPDGLTVRLFRDDRPILRLPQLAIHLDDEISDKGLKLNRQRHMVPVWGGIASAADFRSYLATRLDTSVDDIVSWDAMPFDLAPAAIVGLNEEFIATARVDNQLSCFLAVDALMAAAEAPGSRIPMIGLFDHEEVGSVS
ncbi:MAG: M18 family aminopeptidase, partial [Acidimicrobiaceae bacterium]|nr:M18 family aminopeptidase [Acidimicrobiaceae bacterium]